MGNSIFKNFDPEEMLSQFNVNTPFGFAPNLYLVIVQAISSCSRWETIGDCKTLHNLTNDEFKTLAKTIHYLAKIGFENRTTLPWAEDDAESIEFDEYSICEWALHGKECKKDSKVTATQINAIAALWFIDDAMTAASSEGITLKFIEALSMAAFYLSEARDSEAHDSLTTAKSAITSDMESEIRRRKSKSAALHASIRYANDPKQTAKRLVKECWKDWKIYPTRYKSQTAFANDVLAKVETNEEGNPIISFDTIVKKWIPAWTKDKK